MATPLIIMGAGGRMGRTIATLAEEDNSYSLAALVDRADYLAQLHGDNDCLITDDLRAALTQCAGAVIIDFTAPEVSLKTARQAAESGHAAVIGTTGLDEAQRAELAELAQSSVPPDLTRRNGLNLQSLPKKRHCSGHPT